MCTREVDAKLVCQWSSRIQSFLPLNLPLNCLKAPKLKQTKTDTVMLRLSHIDSSRPSGNEFIHYRNNNTRFCNVFQIKWEKRVLFQYLSGQQEIIVKNKEKNFSFNSIFVDSRWDKEFIFTLPSRIFCHSSYFSFLWNHETFVQ